MQRRRRGFTLVELLVVMTLLGLIATALFGGLRFGVRAWESGGARSAAFAEIEIAQSLLRRLLELEVPEIFNGAVEIKAISREAGSRSKVAVVARQAGVVSRGGELYVRGGRSGERGPPGQPRGIVLARFGRAAGCLQS